MKTYHGQRAGVPVSVNLLCVALALGLTNPAASADPPEAVHAVVKIPSHGCSGTVIATAKGGSWILSCAHGFQGQDAQKPIKLIVPMKGIAPEAKGKPRLVAVQLDERRGIDLSLIFLPAGPLPYVAPVATGPPEKGQAAWSVGYDKMAATSVKVPTQVLGADLVTYTKERPVPGRSGGALLTSEGHLVGVVIGYEVRPQGRGLYVSHQTILGWLKARSTGRPPRVRVRLSARPVLVEGEFTGKSSCQGESDGPQIGIPNL